MPEKKKPSLTKLAKDKAMQKRRRAIADPTRLRILGLLDERDMTAKEMADRLDKDANRLYYHLRILEDADIVGSTESRANGRVLERVFSFKDPDQRFIWDVEEPIEMATYLAAQMELERVDAEKVLFAQARAAEAKEQLPAITWARPSFMTSHDEIEELAKRLWDLQQEFRARGKKLGDEATKRASLFYLVREDNG